MTNTQSDSSGSDTDGLTPDERALFERLADKYEEKEIGRIFELVLQSTDSDSEEARS